MLVAAKEAGAERFFYSSSACVYNADKQTRADVTALKEEDAYPADAGGRLRLGEAVQGAYAAISAEDYGSPPGSPGFTTSSVRSVPTTAAGKVAGGDLSQGIAAKDRARRRSRSGATVSRPAYCYIDDCIGGTIVWPRVTTWSR